jgi:hypothetical protein
MDWSNPKYNMQIEKSTPEISLIQLIWISTADLVFCLSSLILWGFLDAFCLSDLILWGFLDAFKLCV